MLDGKQTIQDAVVGLIIFGVFSGCTQLLHQHPAYMKMVGFWWAAPLSFLYLLFIAQSYGHSGVENFSFHAALGLGLTLATALTVTPVRKCLVAWNYSPTIILLLFTALTIGSLVVHAWLVLKQ